MAGQMVAKITLSALLVPAMIAVILAVARRVDGRVPHAMLLEFFTSKGAGTLIRKG